MENAYHIISIHLNVYSSQYLVNKANFKNGPAHTRHVRTKACDNNNIT